MKEQRHVPYLGVMWNNHLGEELPGKIIHRGSRKAKVGPVKHRLLKPKNANIRYCDDVEIFDCSLRSYDKFENKISKGEAAYERTTTLDKDVGHVWRSLYQNYKIGDLRK